MEQLFAHLAFFFYFCREASNCRIAQWLHVYRRRKVKLCNDCTYILLCKLWVLFINMLYASGKLLKFSKFSFISLSQENVMISQKTNLNEYYKSLRSNVITLLETKSPAKRSVKWRKSNSFTLSPITTNISQIIRIVIKYTRWGKIKNVKISKFLWIWFYIFPSLTYTKVELHLNCRERLTVHALESSDVFLKFLNTFKIIRMKQKWL